jgi:heme/copper-type cytochrome/quinol oxidase subunit 2
MRLRRYALLLLMTLALTAPALGQGCSMCSSSAGATGEKGRKTFIRAVAVLLFPTLGMMALIVGAAFRYRNRDEQQPDA